MRTHEHDHGFTLIELLVVMSILGVLASIAVPLLFRERDHAYHTAMQSDLHAIIVSEAAWLANNPVYTSDPTQLAPEGYSRTSGVTAHIALSGSDYVACTKHSAVADWLVYDSATSQFMTSAADCA